MIVEKYLCLLNTTCVMMEGGHLVLWQQRYVDVLFKRVRSKHLKKLSSIIEHNC